MRKIALCLALLVSVSLSGCLAGPHQMRRTVDDWDHELYVEQPWLDAVLWIIPVFPFANFGATFVDFFITDAYAFWIKDAFAGDGGTGYQHAQVEAKRRMHSLIDGGSFLEIK